MSASDAPLAGISRFSFGDDGAWSSPAYDDSSWGLSRAAQPSRDLNPAVRSRGWYRIHLPLPASSLKWTDPAILLGRISGAEEIFLNGVKIGSEGVIGDGFVSAAKVERLCRIPRELLHHRGDNLLAVRIMSLHPAREEFSGRIRIGDYNILFAEKVRSESRQIVIEGAILIILLHNFIILGLNIITGTLPKRMMFFGAFIFLYLAVYAMDSLFFYQTGWKTPLVQRTYFACIALLSGTVFFLYQEKMTLSAKAAAAAIALAALSVMFFPIRQIYPLLPYAWCLLVAVSGIWTLKIAWQNVAKKVPEGNIVLIGALCVFSAGILFAAELLFPLHPFQFYEELLWVLGGPVFLYLWIYTIIKRFNRIQNNQIKEILVTQEREGARLARELHDGIGQSLLAIKLNLDMMEMSADRNKTIKGAAVSELKEEVAKIIDDVRSVATALRPSFLDRMNLSETIRDDGRRLERTSGIKIAINAADVGDLPPQAKHNAYRIYQEGMTNILKHASATMVQVNLAVQGKALVLEITDNGRGFDATQIDESSEGLGLSIMRERAKLIGGTLVIKTAPGSGTSILAEVPLL